MNVPGARSAALHEWGTLLAAASFKRTRSVGLAFAKLASRIAAPIRSRPWRSSVACVFDPDCGGDPALVDEKPPSVELIQCELMPH